MNKQINTLCKIRDLYKDIHEFEVDFAQKHELGLNDAMLLCTLFDGQHSSNELARMLGLGYSNTSKIIKDVEDKGLINRTMGTEDKRKMFFDLTEAGKKKINSIKNSLFNIPEVLGKVIEL